jgi:purine-nucleoside phosphorylase
MMTKIAEATTYIQSMITSKPMVGIVLGSGLASFAEELVVELEIPYKDIPHFPVSTVKGHSGKLIFAQLMGKQVVVMAGRFHFYEGYSAQEVVFPIRVMKMLGIELLMLSNAAGGTNPDFIVGDLMIITDHISQFMENPLIGKNLEALGTRFPDMSEPYQKHLVRKAKDIAEKAGYDIKTGVYIGVTGPTFETKAEYKMVHMMGADAAGMSTVQEVIAAVHMGLPVFAMSVITDLGMLEGEFVITHEEVLEAAKAAEPKFSHIFKEMVSQL